jgi:hypothetical protein
MNQHAIKDYSEYLESGRPVVAGHSVRGVGIARGHEHESADYSGPR